MASMIEKLKEYLNSITPEQFEQEIKQIQDEGFTTYLECPDDCPHCAYERQEAYEAELERDAAIDFAKWIAQDWMSIWVEDKWMWECQTEQSPYSETYGYLTEEQLYELYLKS